MTELELTREVMKLCDDLGLLYHHCPNSSRCQGPKGFPDLVIAGEHGVMFAELKSEDGENSAEQDLWAWTLRRGSGIGAADPRRTVHYTHWRPIDLEDGVIRAWLKVIR